MMSLKMISVYSINVLSLFSLLQGKGDSHVPCLNFNSSGSSVKF